MTEQVLQQIQKHEGKWVALFGPETETKIVAVGRDALDASEQAKKKGFADTTLMKVLPTDAAYVPLA